MKKRRRIGAVIVALCLLTGCTTAPMGGSNPPEQSSQPTTQGADALRIGMALYTLENDYTVRFATAAAAYAVEHDIQLDVYDGNYDAATQISQVEQMIADGVDGIILNPRSATECAPCVDMAVAAGVPLISVNTRVEHDQLTSYVGSDDVEAGRLLLQETAKALSGSGNIAILEGPVGQSAQTERLAGMRAALQDYEDMNVLSVKTANWSMLEAEVVVQKWLSTFDQLDAIVAQNDNMALGAVKAAQDAGVQLVIVGMDGSQAALEAVEQGELWLTVFQNAEAQGETCLQVMAAAIAGETVDSEYLIPLEIVTNENVQDYLSE